MNEKIYLLRHERLSRIWRYKWYRETMWYRTNVSTHTKRVCIIVKEVCSVLKKLWCLIDEEYILKLAEIHDDEEMITDDIASPTKDKFTQEEKDTFEQKKKEARKILIAEYSELFDNPKSYGELLQEEGKQKSINYFIMKYVDKLEANMEVSHEIIQWNTQFILAHNDKWDFEVNTFEYSFSNASKYLDKLCENLDISRKEIEHYDIFNLTSPLDYKNKEIQTANSTNNHKEKTWYTPYDKRLELLSQSLSYEEKEKLWDKNETIIL